MRGTLNVLDTQPQAFRFIPACAGNTTGRFTWGSRATVHPRVCGEHLIRQKPFHFRHGSSPRVRGTRGSFRARLRKPRFIPACAGNTTPAASGDLPEPVHPRVCGEHWLTYTRTGSPDGSSPRVRGTRAGQSGAGQRSRFIPACAGNTVPGFLRCCAGSVHPRVCGKHDNPKGVNRDYYGSSPRVRGTPREAYELETGNRFIPACAGNT